MATSSRMGWRFLIVASACTIGGCSDQLDFDCKSAKTYLREVNEALVASRSTDPAAELKPIVGRSNGAECHFVFAQVHTSKAAATSSMDQLIREVNMSKQEMAKSLEFLGWLQDHLASVLHEAESLPVGSPAYDAT